MFCPGFLAEFPAGGNMISRARQMKLNPAFQSFPMVSQSGRNG
jgi:hypothetical protein